jgi:hypothetical protein
MIFLLNYLSKRRKKMFSKKIMGFLFLAIILNASIAFGADVTAAVDLNSAYIWRGLTLNDGLVAQPSLDVTSGGLDINVWGNYDLSDYDGTLEKYNFSEIDLTLAYTHTLGPVDLTGGIIEYLFPTTDKGGAESTQEVFLGASFEPFEKLKGFSVGATGYYDFDQVDSYYISPSIGYSMDFCEGFSMDMGASCGIVGEDYAKKVSGGTDAGFNEYTLTLGTSYTIDVYTFSGQIGYTDAIDNDVYPDPDVNFYGGAGVAVAF